LQRLLRENVAWNKKFMLKHILLPLFFTLVTFNLFSQKVDKKGYFLNMLKHIDSIKVVCFQNNDTTKHFINKQDLIKTFTEMITGRQDMRKIDTKNKKGYLVYYQNHSPKLKVEILNSGIRYNYKGMSIISLLTYQADMLFIETCGKTGFNIKE
jgi:hypothetical protein